MEQPEIRPLAVFEPQGGYDFPLVMEFYNETTLELLHTITIDGPGLFDVPGWGHTDFKVTTVVTYGDGGVEIATSDGRSEAYGPGTAPTIKEFLR